MTNHASRITHHAPHNTEHGTRLTDLPPWAISLMRQLLRDCHRPGEYNVRLEIHDHPCRVRVQIEQINRLRDYEP